MMDLQKMKEYRNNHNPFCQKVGVSVQEVRPNYARAVKIVAPDDANPVGVAHGGLYFTLCDAVCAYAMGTRGYKAVTINSTLNFLKGAKVGTELIAEAFEIKSGKTICVYEARITDQKGTLLSNGTFTFFQLEEKLSFGEEDATK